MRAMKATSLLIHSTFSYAEAAEIYNIYRAHDTEWNITYLNLSGRYHHTWRACLQGGTPFYQRHHKRQE